jgi:glycyl-tRNA synthetase
MPAPNLETLVALCQRRGFVYRSSEIYGGLSAAYDYGHYGVQLKRNLRDAWWDSMLRDRRDIVALDSAIIQHPQVWEASEHRALFNDPVVSCDTCGARLRADHVAQGVEPCPAKPSKAAGTGPGCRLGEPTQFNLMFATTAGPAGGMEVFLRPETAQGIFINFEQVLKTTRMRVPFGIAQIGKSFRNEITARQFVFRTREFEQAEMEFFCHPDDAADWYEHWREQRIRWYTDLGVSPTRLRLREHGADERAHCSTATADIEYNFPFGWSEIEGVAHRGNFDLTQHIRHSGAKLEYFDDRTRQRYVPHVIEPAAGLDRAFLTFLADAYDEDYLGGERRVVLRLHPRLAPVKVAVMPLLRKNGHPERATEIFETLRRVTACEYDDSGRIGKRYRRQDEVGTPWCVTVDHQTLDDGTVTFRDRDTLQQTRVPDDRLPALLTDRLSHTTERHV